MIPESFAPTLELLSSGDLEKIRVGLKDAQALGADIPQVIKTLEAILDIGIEDAAYDDILNEIERFEQQIGDINDVTFIENTNFNINLWEKIIPIEKVLIFFPRLTKYLPWIKEIKPNLIIYRLHNFNFKDFIYYTENQIQSIKDNLNDLTHHSEVVDLNIINQTKTPYIEFESGDFYIEKLLSNFTDLTNFINEEIDNNGYLSGYTYLNSDDTSLKNDKFIIRIKELFPNSDIILQFEGEDFSGQDSYDEHNQDDSFHLGTFYLGVIAQLQNTKDM